MTHADSQAGARAAVAAVRDPAKRPTITVACKVISPALHFLSVPLVDNFVVPVDFSATVWDDPRLPCKLTFVFAARYGRPVVVERRERAKDERDEVPASKDRRPDRELERMMLATAATPADQPERSLFGKSYDVVFPILGEQRDSRISTRELGDFAKRYRLESTRNKTTARLAAELHVDAKTMRVWRREAIRAGLLERLELHWARPRSRFACETRSRAQVNGGMETSRARS